MNNVNLNIEKGQIYGLVGRNGAGKTTIIRMITAQTVPTEGESPSSGPPSRVSWAKCAPAPAP